MLKKDNPQLKENFSAYENLMAKQTSLTEKANVLLQELMTIKEESDNVNRFMRTICKYEDINELTPYLVRNFIDKVVVR